MDDHLQIIRSGEQEAVLPVCSLQHRVRNSGTDTGHPYRYKCCDSRDCHWKKQAEGGAFCLFDQAHW